jgi:hypothetical protein
MNFSQMLMAHVTPLFAPEDKDDKVESQGNRRKRIESRVRLESTMPEGEWVAGAELARRLGTSTDSLNKTLSGFRARGEVESRVINEKKRNLEWRWV